MASFDWNKSGRVDTFVFEKIKPERDKQLNTVIGKLEGVKAGTLSFSQDSETIVSGTLEVVDQESNLAEQNFLIRVKYRATLDGETVETTLGTFYFTAEMSFDKGVYNGTLTLNSTLTRYSEDTLPRKWTLKKGSTYRACFQHVIKSFGGWGGLANFTGKTKVKKNKVFSAGETVLSVLRNIAKNCGGQINVTPQGKVVMQKYVKPSVKVNKGTPYRITTQKDSVVCQGMSISNSFKSIPNRAVVVCEKDKKTYYGTATLKTGNNTYAKTGKWLTKVYQVDNITSAAKLKKLAQTKLKAANHKVIKYTFDCFYQPISIGDPIELIYDDIHVYGVVRSIDMDLSIGGKMTVTMRKVAKK